MASPELAMLDMHLIMPKELGSREISIKEFLERDIILNTDDSTPLSADMMYEKLNEIMGPIDESQSREEIG